MKTISLLLSLCMTFNVLAVSAPMNELERSLDEYQYALTVEWDQKDKNFYNEQTDQFIASVTNLIQNQGLTTDEILKLSEKRVQDKKVYEALKLKMNLLNESMSAEEMAQVLKSSSDSFYVRGASWNGDAVLLIPFAAFVIIMGVAAWYALTHECVEYENEYICDDDGFGRNINCNWEETCTRTERKK